MQLEIGLLQIHLGLGQGILQAAELSLGSVEANHNALALLFCSCILLV